MHAEHACALAEEPQVLGHLRGEAFMAQAQALNRLGRLCPEPGALALHSAGWPLDEMSAAMASIDATARAFIMRPPKPKRLDAVILATAGQAQPTRCTSSEFFRMEREWRPQRRARSAAPSRRVVCVPQL